MKMPKTPFSTRLSGSAKETELRIRSIFQWKKKRPPAVVFILVVIVLLSCFSLFSCQVQEGPADDPVNEVVQSTVLEQTPPVESSQPGENGEKTTVWNGEPIPFLELTVLPPDGWKRRVSYALDGEWLYFYHLATAAEIGSPMTGALYSVNYEQTVLPLNYSLPWPGGVIAVSDQGTYLYSIPSDVNWIPKTELEYAALAAQYGQMEFILAEGLTGQTTAEKTLLPTDIEYRDQLICEFYSDMYQRGVYMAHEMPEQVQQGDERIDEIVVLGETRVYEVTGQLLEIYMSYYDGSNWNQYSSHLVITKGIDNAYDQIIGTAYIREGQTAEDVILEKVHGLSDLEVSLWREGYPWPVGPGSRIHIYREAYDGPETVEVRNDWEPIHYEGDYWAIHRWSGVEAICYHRAADGGYGVNTFDTTRTDLFTYRGIRVGDSRAKVMETYPELKSGDYWGKYPGEDYLWYCESDIDLGPALIFFFENEIVSRIVLIDMFN